MKTRNILNGTFVLVLILAFIALPSQVVAVDDPSIKILKVKTLNNEKEPQTNSISGIPFCSVSSMRLQVTKAHATRSKGS